MKNNIILKIKFINGKIKWKLDTLWSLSSNMKEAKTHNVDSIPELLNNLLYIINYSCKEKNEEDKSKFLEHWNNSLVGYDFIEEKSNYKFDFIKEGFFDKKISFNFEKNKFEFIDVSRKNKLYHLKELEA